jgi:hypothetical protein
MNPPSSLTNELGVELVELSRILDVQQKWYPSLFTPT